MIVAAGVANVSEKRGTANRKAFDRHMDHLTTAFCRCSQNGLSQIRMDLDSHFDDFHNET